MIKKNDMLNAINTENFTKIDRDRGTSPAELRSSGPKLRPDKGSVEPSALDGESIRRDVPADDMNVFKDKTISDDYKSGGAYKAMLSLFADHVSEEEYLEHCRRFFKGDNENNT